ncbi:hypothetical protein KI387_006360, partial [Taxus chinensis]
LDKNLSQSDPCLNSVNDYPSLLLVIASNLSGFDSVLFALASSLLSILGH